MRIRRRIIAYFLATFMSASGVFSYGGINSFASEAEKAVEAEIIEESTEVIEDTAETEEDVETEEAVESYEEIKLEIPEEREELSCVEEVVYGDNTKEAGDKLYNDMLKLEAEIDLSGYGIDMSSISNLVFNVLDKYPELFFVNRSGFSVRYDDDGMMILFVKYCEDAKNLMDAVDKAKDNALKDMKLDGLTDLEKLLVIHDYINTEIDYPCVIKDNGDGTYTVTVDSVSTHIRDIYGAAVEKSVVCQGYAELMVYYLRTQGIESCIVSSAEAKHAWVAVKLDGSWYHCDPTFDDPVYNILGRTCHSYFLVSTSKLVSMEPERSDMVVGYIDENYQNQAVSMTDTSYDTSPFWADVNAIFYPYGGYLYYTEKIKSGKSCISRINAKTGEKEQLTQVEDGYFWTSQLSYTKGFDKYLFFATAEEIKRYQIDTGEIVTVQKNNDELKDIIGFGSYYGRMAFALETSPNLTVKQTPVYFNCLTHTYYLSERKAVTAAEDGYEKYECYLCGDYYTNEISALPKLTGVTSCLTENSYNKVSAKVSAFSDRECEFEYRYSIKKNGVTTVIKDWSGSDTVDWVPDNYGALTLLSEARCVGNETEVSGSELSFECHPYLSGTCQMPNPYGSGYLIGLTSYKDKDKAYDCEMLILDCTLYMQGKDAWVYTTNKIKMVDNAMWTIWDPQYGYYWTLFRIYDKDGTIIDEVCYGFENI